MNFHFSIAILKSPIFVNYFSSVGTKSHTFRPKKERLSAPLKLALTFVIVNFEILRKLHVVLPD